MKKSNIPYKKNCVYVPHFLLQYCRLSTSDLAFAIRHPTFSPTKFPYSIWNLRFPSSKRGGIRADESARSVTLREMNFCKSVVCSCAPESYLAPEFLPCSGKKNKFGHFLLLYRYQHQDVAQEMEGH